MAPRLLILLIYSVALCSASASTASENDHRRPMILHLHLTSSDDGRRLQRSEPNAHMRLHDDLLINGYYTTRLWIGTPPQMFALIVDTGSSVTYVPCSDCLDCGEHQDPRFKPESSTTYQPVKCNVNCNCDENGEQCMYERRYAEQSSSSGVLGEDVVSFGNESALTPQRAVFGCESFETGDLYTQRADGIMGLGRGELSMMDQLVAKGVISDSFSLCFGGMGLGGGTMVLGRIKSPRDMVFAESDPNRSPYYNIELKGIHVAGKALNLNSDVFDQKYGTVLDSGTTYTYLPKDAFIEFKNAIMKETHDLKQIDGPDLNYNDICFSTAGRDVTQLSKVFPQVDMVFSKGNKFSLSHENYLFPHKKVNGAYCLGVFENEDPTTLLGGIFVRNTLVTYDREDNKVGFWKTNCSELWKSLNHENAPVSAPGPASTDWNLRRGISPDIAPAPAPTDWDLSRGISPDIASAPASTDENLNGWVSPYISPAPASNDWDLNGGISPDIASGGLPPTDLPAECQIGQISFDLMFNISTSTEPNFTELSESIARGLEVKISQVHLKNFNMSEVGLLIRWTIVPDESANRFSTEKAKNIRVHLMRHEMQLPHEFGSYELTKLNFQRKRSWWEQHSWMVAVGVSVASVLALSALGAWLIWRNRSRRGISYEPVGGISGATASEQELQPLR